jgi:hypothetical protein
MVKLTEADKNYIKLLILDCENFHLNKKESLAYISKKLSRKFSRTSYYSCKSETSENDIYGYFYWDSRFKKSFSIIHNITERTRIVNSSSDSRIRSHNVWDDADFVSRYSDRFFADANDVIARTNRLSGRINSQRALADKNYKSIPSHANIREESVKCGKPDCNRCKHGPYYYAYWKENGKLKKKYIGRYDPRKETKKQNDLQNHFK